MGIAYNRLKFQVWFHSNIGRDVCGYQVFDYHLVDTSQVSQAQAMRFCDANEVVKLGKYVLLKKRTY